MQCLAVVPSLHFTSVFGAISSNLSKSFWILALSPKCPCHPSLIALVCMHNKPTPSSLTVSSMQTQDRADTGEGAAQASIQTGNHWKQQLPRDLPSRCVHAWSHSPFATRSLTKDPWNKVAEACDPKVTVTVQHHYSGWLRRWRVEGPFPGRSPLLCEQLAGGWVRCPVMSWLLRNPLSQAIFPFEVSWTWWARSLISPSAKFSLMRFIQLFQHGLTLSIQSGQKGSFILLT